MSKIGKSLKIIVCLVLLALTISTWAVFQRFVATANARKTLNDAMSLRSAVERFTSNYGHPPLVGKTEFLSDGPEASHLFEILQGLGANQISQNPEEIRFLRIERKMLDRKPWVFDSRDRIVGMRDAWGEPFEIFLSGQPPQPLVFHDGTQVVTLPNRVAAVLSKGPDKIRGTKDDLRTWESVR